MRCREPTWSESDSLAIVGALSVMVPDCHVVWDFDAGERWAYVRAGGDLKAVVRMVAPLVFVFADDLDLRVLFGDERAVVLAVTDPRRPELAASAEVIAAAFPQRPVSTVLAPFGFSVLDLCFATD